MHVYVCAARTHTVIYFYNFLSLCVCVCAVLCCMCLLFQQRPFFLSLSVLIRV